MTETYGYHDKARLLDDDDDESHFDFKIKVLFSKRVSQYRERVGKMWKKRLNLFLFSSVSKNVKPFEFRYKFSQTRTYKTSNQRRPRLLTFRRTRVVFFSADT